MNVIYADIYMCLHKLYQDLLDHFAVKNVLCSTCRWGSMNQHIQENAIFLQTTKLGIHEFTA